MTERKEKKLRRLRAWHYLAMEMRYQGKEYPEISQAIMEKFGKEFKAGSLRNWFSDGGKLFSLYYEFTEKMNNGLIKEARVWDRALLQKSYRRLSEGLDKGNDSDAIKIAIFLIERTVGKASENINLNISELENLSDDELLKRLQAVTRGEGGDNQDNSRAGEAEKEPISQLGSGELDEQGNAAGLQASQILDSDLPRPE